MANSLLADRDTARYSDEEFRRQSSSIAGGTVAGPASSSSEPVANATQEASPPPIRNRNIVAQEIPPAAAVPDSNVAPPIPAVPNQPIPVNPNNAPSSVGLPQPPQPPQMPAVSSMPPPPPVIAANRIPAPDAFPPRQLDFPELPPAVNPSVGGPAIGRPAPLAQQDGGFFDADRFAPRFPNEVGLPQRPVLTPPAIESAQSDQPTSPPVATILFADGSARIGRADLEIIRQVYNGYRARGGRIHVVGHASSRTRNLDQASHQLANFSISYERAGSVAEALQRLGVPPEALVVTAMSDQEPSFFEVMPAGEAGNRRVEIYFEN